MILTVTCGQCVHGP